MTGFTEGEESDDGNGGGLVFGMSPFPPTITNCTEPAVTLCALLHKVAA